MKHVLDFCAFIKDSCSLEPAAIFKRIVDPAFITDPVNLMNEFNTKPFFFSIFLPYSCKKTWINYMLLHLNGWSPLDKETFREIFTYHGNNIQSNDFICFPPLWLIRA